MAGSPHPELDIAVRLHEAGRLAEAERAYRRILEGNPDHADATQLLGVVCLQTGRDSESIDLSRRALELRPHYPEAYNNLGVALEGRGELPEAEASYRRAIQLSSGYFEAHNNLGNVLRKMGRLDEAVGAYEAALRLRPTGGVAYSGLGMAMLERGNLDEALKHYWRWASLQGDSPAAHSDLLFWLLHHPRYTAAQLYEAHVKWGRRHADVLAAVIEPHGNDRDSARPLRVGYVSPDFREHTVARFIEPVLAGHDPDKVVTVCYSDVARPDGVTDALRALAREWRDVAGLSDAQLASLVRQDRIDILVDLTGHMGRNRLMAFARKPAPVQATYLGYPHTTGLGTIDYRITDAESDPPGMTDAYHVERLVRLSGCAWCYRPTESPAVGPLPAAVNGYVTFGAFNRMAKTTPAVASLWGRVLQAVPGSRLLVLANGGESNTAARRMLETAGVDGSRLRLVPTGTRREYLELCGQADIALDPFPYNGMTTTCDLLWMGVPVVTLAGTTHVSRVGLSLLRAAGLPEFVAHLPEEYVSIAADAAGDLLRLRELRVGLRDRLARSDLTNEVGIARKLEAAFREMWAQWAEKQPKNPR